VFRVGNRSVSMDVLGLKPINSLTSEAVYDRFYIWQATEDDAALAETAGWAKYSKGESEGYSYLAVPTGTRGARSILAGMQAWAGEKDEIIDFIGDYVQAVNEDGETFDTSISLDTVARTKDGEFFILPPHKKVHDEELAAGWAQALKTDIEAVLISDEQQSEVVEKFETTVEAKLQRRIR
jgi:hypothetical protein